MRLSSYFFINSMNRKMAPEMPDAIRIPFQKSVKKSLFIYYRQVISGYVVFDMAEFNISVP